MSKKNAKNAAASSLLDKLISNHYFGNIVGQLQEFCVAQNLPLPLYADETKEAYLQNECGFTISCSVQQRREFGHGRNKKMAKFLAAYKVWLKFKN